MFYTHDGRTVRRFAFGLTLLSLMTLSVTAWILSNVRRERELVDQLTAHLPRSDLQDAEELSGDLQLQSSLSVLLVLNIVATGVAFALVVRGYLSSERSLQNAKVLSNDILASMDEAVMTTDKHGIVTSLNPSGCELLNRHDDLLGWHLREIDPQHQSLSQLFSETESTQRPTRDRDYKVVREGQDRTLRAGCTMLQDRDANQIGTVIHVRDVTEKELMETRLRRMERNIGLDSLAAGLQHEIRNPLSALSLHIQLLSERLEPELADPEIAEFLDVLQTEVHRVSDVLDGFGNYASVDNVGRMPINIGQSIEKLIRLLRPEAAAKSITLVLEADKAELPDLLADSARLEQVLLNLALNGLASMPNGGTLRFEVLRYPSTLESSEHCGVQINVVDTGSGIPADVQSKIFDPYFTTRANGTGMGLAFCDKIIRQHHGTLDFTTNDSGTKFSVRIPMETKESR
jgi:two-component system nitrogen regulation sensor histidine kinase GlnL